MITLEELRSKPLDKETFYPYAREKKWPKALIRHLRYLIWPVPGVEEYVWALPNEESISNAAHALQIVNLVDAQLPKSALCSGDGGVVLYWTFHHRPERIELECCNEGHYWNIVHKTNSMRDYLEPTYTIPWHQILPIIASKKR